MAVPDRSMVAMSRPARSASPAHALAALSWCALLGCKPSPEPDPLPEPGAARATPTQKPDRASDRPDAGEEQERDLPILNEDALLARVQAQKALLGDNALFEDADGRPLEWISPQNELPEPETHLVDDDLLTSLPGSSGLGGDEADDSGPRVNGNALGLFEPIEDPSEGQALASFYRALSALQEGTDPDGKVRVLAYGASHTDADVYPHYIRTYLQERFGDGGHGFVHVAKPWRWYGHFDVAVEGFKYWKTRHAQRRGDLDDGFFGLLGASLSTGSKRAFGRVSHRNGSVGSHYELHYLRQPRGGSFRVIVDGQPQAVVKTRAKDFGPGYHGITLPEGPHEIEVQPIGNGDVRMFGMVIERDQPGVVVDTLGIGGTRAANMLAWDEELWADNVSRRQPDLVTLAYGTNEATDANQPIEEYEANLREVVGKIQRVAPQASCLLVGPGDFPQGTPDGGWIPRPRVRQIVAVQRQVASEMGCGFWDAQAFMGGELSMLDWARAIPPMAKSDHIHLTRRGYVRMGMALVDAMMMPYDGGDVSAGPPLGLATSKP